MTVPMCLCDCHVLAEHGVPYTHVCERCADTERTQRRAEYLDDKGDQWAAHRRYYSWLAEQVGTRMQLRALMPVQDEAELRERLAQDKHLNNVPLPLWDRRDPQMRVLAVRAGFRSWSLCETVCVLKEVATQMAEEDGDAVQP